MNTEDMSFEQLCELFSYTPKRRPLETSEAAACLSLDERTLENYRYRGVGPRYFNPPHTRKVWYAERDVLNWLASGARHNTSGEPAPLAA